MQLYKGNATADGTVDWVDPIPLPGPPKTEDLEKGRILFQQNCASCHSSTRKSTGPALAFIDQRRDWQWLRNWVANSAAMIAAGDRLAVGIYDIYNKTAMTAFPYLHEEELRLIFEYANYEARDIDPNTIPDYKKIIDSCDRYCESISGRKRKQSPAVVPFTNSQWYQEWRKTRYSVANSQDTTLEEHINYKINVICFGWYNVDILTKNLPGFDSSILTINAALAGNTNLTVSILLPGKKILLQGRNMPNHPDTYVFYNDNGTIPLPQNEKAIVFAFGTKDSKDYFGVTEFITSTTNQYAIPMQPTTQQKIDQWLAGLDTLRQMDPIAAMLSLADTGKIETDTTTIGRLKPRSYNCDCEQPFDEYQILRNPKQYPVVREKF
jgi:mono/diheme cytochrome c family protein